MLFLPPEFQLVLASKSPRRQQLLRDLGYDFIIRSVEVEEDHAPELKAEAIAEYLALKKAEAQIDLLNESEILISSDTVVWCNGASLAKAQNEQEAISMLQKISGRVHEVITGVCMLSTKRKEIFSCSTEVKFAELTDEIMEYYIKHYQPFDKAGAYGIQEWIGMWAIEEIRGSYFNVVGLPTHMIPGKLSGFVI